MTVATVARLPLIWLLHYILGTKSEGVASFQQQIPSIPEADAFKYGHLLRSNRSVLIRGGGLISCMNNETVNRSNGSDLMALGC